MKAKKMLSVVLAAATMTSMMQMSVLADTIEGGTVYIDQDVYNVVLPTTASMKFYLDPQGLTTLTNAGAAGNSAGTIVGANLDMHAINKSSAPVALSATYKLEAKKKDDSAATGLTIVDSVSDNGAAVKAAADKQVAVSVTAEPDTTTYSGDAWKAGESDTDISENGTALTTETTYAKSAGAAITFIMDKATYTIEKKSGDDVDIYDPSTYTMKYTEGTGTDLKLSIGGFCSQKADWSAYAKGDEKLILSATFGFKKVDASDDTAATVGDSITVVPEVTTSEDATVTFSEAPTAGKVSIVAPGGTTYTPSAKDIAAGATVAVNGNNFTVKSSALSIWATTNGFGKGTYTVKLTLTSGSTEDMTFVLK